MTKSKPRPRGVTTRGGRTVREHKTGREARRAAGQQPLTFAERRAAADPSVDHDSHSQGWVGECGECPTDLPAEPPKTT